MAHMDRAVVEETQGAFRRTLESQADGYRVVRDHISGIGERNARFAQSVYKGAFVEMERQYKSNRALAGELLEQSSRQREALQTLASESMSAWMSLFDTSPGGYRQGLELVEQSREEAAESLSKTSGTVRDVSREAMEAADAAGKLPIEGYDDMNVEQVKKKLDGLNAAGIRTVREYEKNNKNRETLINQFDRRLKAKTA